MTLYLSDYKKFPKIVQNVQIAGLTTLDSFSVDYADAVNYRTVKYNLTVEDTTTNGTYNSRLTVSHDGLTIALTESDVINNSDLDLDLDATFSGDDGNGRPTLASLTLDFPVGFSGSWSLTREENFINISDIRKTGADGPGEWLNPNPYLYPSP